MALAAPSNDRLFPVDAVGALIDAVSQCLARAPVELEGAVAPFAKALGTIHSAGAVAPPLQGLPVCGHLSDALAAARGTPVEPLAKATAALAPAAFWTQNPNYQHQPPDPGFLESYGYFVVAGPADGPPAFVETPGLALGLLLLGSGTLYPMHRHPAVELYIPFAGDGEWQKGAEPWRAEPAGAVIHHPSGVPHATRAGMTPLLAAYLWLGEVATHARLSER